MALQAGQYSMQCWHSTSNPNDMSWPKLIHQCLQLIKSLQSRFTNGEIAIPSRDQKDSRKGIEICIIYRPEKQLFGDIASYLSRTSIEKSLDYQNFVKQHAGITRYFNDQEIGNVSVLATPIPDDLTEEKIAQIAGSVREYEGFKMNNDWKNSTQAKQRSMPFQITRSTLQRLHQKEGANLCAEIHNIMDGFKAAQGETKSAWQLITMLAKGAVAVVGSVGVFGEAVAGTILCVEIVYAVVGVAAAAIVGAALLAIVAVFACKSSHFSPTHTFTDGLPHSRRLSRRQGRPECASCRQRHSF